MNRLLTPAPDYNGQYARHTDGTYWRGHVDKTGRTRWQRIPWWRIDIRLEAQAWEAITAIPVIEDIQPPTILRGNIRP